MKAKLIAAILEERLEIILKAKKMAVILNIFQIYFFSKIN